VTRPTNHKDGIVRAISVRQTSAPRDVTRGYFSLAYSALAAMRTGMSESAFFQSARKS
jgi:hypothetical protein